MQGSGLAKDRLEESDQARRSPLRCSQQIKPKALREAGREAVERHEKYRGIGRTGVACQTLLPCQSSMFALLPGQWASLCGIECWICNWEKRDGDGLCA